MAALQAVAAFIEMLRGLPASTVQAERVGLGRPAGAAELPAIVVSLGLARETGIGLGNLVHLAEVEPGSWAATTGSRVKGELRLELWAADAAGIATLTSAVLDRARAQAMALRAGGFLGLSLSLLGPAQPVRAGLADAQMMPLAYAADFEHLVTPPTGDAGVIRTVHVDLVGEIGESTDIH
jgi:hypothetical protein